MSQPAAAIDSGMRHKFDVECGYAALNDASCAAMSRPIPAGPFDLLAAGVERVATLDRKSCAYYRARMDGDDPVLKNRTFKLEMLDKVLAGEVDRRLTAYFRSEYIPLWCRFYKAEPESAPSVSFRWHCDGGPSRHLKLLVYLNSCDEHGGDTIFADRTATEAFKRVGYVFCEVDRRQADLTRLAADTGIAFEPLSLHPDAGDALIFEPMSIMHRGCWPRFATRYMIQICLLPSPVAWREMTAAFELPGERNDWPVVGVNWPAEPLSVARTIS